VVNVTDPYGRIVAFLDRSEIRYGILGTSLANPFTGEEVAERVQLLIIHFRVLEINRENMERPTDNRIEFRIPKM
jgi:hypothetical protein